MPKIEWVTIEGRQIKIHDDEKTQSVNVCKPANVEGDYEQVFYFRTPFRVTAADLTSQLNLDATVSWLRRRSYDQLQ